MLPDLSLYPRNDEDDRKRRQQFVNADDLLNKTDDRIIVSVVRQLSRLPPFTALSLLPLDVLLGPTNAVTTPGIGCCC